MTGRCVPEADRARSEEARTFLEAAFAVRTPGRIVIASFRDGRQQRHSMHDGAATAAAAAIRAEARGCDVYFALGRNLLDGHAAAGVEALSMAWTDLDAKTDEERAAAYDRIGEFDPSPSAFVASASGFHPYWFFRAATPPEVTRAINEAIRRSFKGDPEMHVGADAILRVPGTSGFRSHKTSYDPPRRIRLVRCNFDLRYDAAELADRLGVDLRAEAEHPSPRLPLLTERAFPALLRAVPDHLRVTRVGADGKLPIYCPFHDDARASAVVFAPHGWFHCSACGVNEPAWKWTRRPEVRGWAARHVVRAGGGLFRFPDTAARVAWALRPVPARSQRRTGDTLALRGSETCEPEALADTVRRHAGPLGLRVLAYGIAAAQGVVGGRAAEADAPLRDGEYRFDARSVAEAFGYRGAVGGGRLRTINDAQRALSDVSVKFTIRYHARGDSRAGLVERTFESPLVQPVARDGATCNLKTKSAIWKLHPGIWYGVKYGQLYALADPGALAVHDEQAFAFYLVAIREFRRRTGRLDRLPLAGLLRDAGVPVSGWSHDPARFEKRWRQRVVDLAAKGLLPRATVDARFTLTIPAGAGARESAPVVDGLAEDGGQVGGATMPGLREEPRVVA